jgi:hypothetical protein
MALQALFRLGNPTAGMPANAGFKGLLAFWSGGAANAGVAPPVAGVGSGSDIVFPFRRTPRPEPQIELAALESRRFDQVIVSDPDFSDLTIRILLLIM